MMRWLNGVLSALKQMVNGRTQASMGQTPQAQPGVNNTSAPTRGGKRKLQAAQAQRQSQPASKSAKRKPKAAPSTTAAKSRRPASKPAQTTSGKRGRPRKTPV